MAQAIGTVLESQGVVTVVNEEGFSRQVSAGDQIFESDVISVSGNDGSVSLSFNNGCEMTLGAGETALIDETLYKVEFFDNPEVAVDINAVEGIVDTLAAEELAAGDVYAVSEDEDIDLDEIEDTAAGEEREEAPTTEVDIEENIEIVSGGSEGGGVPEQETTTTQTVEHGITERGGELFVPEAPTFVSFDINSSGFLNTLPTLSGSAPEGSVLEVYDHNESIATVTVGSSGTFSYEPDLEDGEHSITADITTTDGQTSVRSEPIVFTLDTQAPDTVIIESADVVGSSTPTINGRAEALSTVSLTVDGQEYSVIADESGLWSVEVHTLSDGDYDIAVSVTDQAGNTSTSTTTTMTVDTQAPDAPVVDSSDFVNSGNPVISGSAQDGDTVTVTVDSDIYTTTVTTDGSWTVAIEGLADGDHEVNVFVTDSAGNDSPTVSYDLSVDSQAPDAPIVDSIITADGVTTISGNSEASAQITVTVGATEYLVDANEEGLWSVSIENLAGGSHDLLVTAEDAAGNISEASVTQTIVIDSEAPDAPSVSDVVDVNGDYSEVILSGSGGGTGNTINLYDEDGTVIGTAVVGSDGSWSMDISNLGDTPVNDNEFFHAVAIDAAGNMSESSEIVHYWHGSWSSFSTDAFDDYVISGGGNDTYHVRHDDANNFLLFDGGDGRDTVVLHGQSHDYSVTQISSNTVIITHEETGDVLEVRNVENFGFLNGQFDRDALIESGIYTINDSDSNVNLIAEDVENGMLVGITAAGLDISGDNVTYGLVDANGQELTGGAFAIDANSGVVTVADKTQIDYEAATSQTITVQATSEDGSTLEKSFTVTVTDVDDTAPDQPYINEIDVDRSGLLSLDGQAETGSTVRVEIGDNVYTTEANSHGGWALDTQALGSGEFTIAVSATDAAGNSSGAVYAKVNVDTTSVEYDLENGVSETRSFGMDQVTLFGVTTESDFDGSASSLDLSLADVDAVVSHNKGYGIEGGYKGEGDKKAIGSDEALVIKLDSAVDNVDISINKLNFYEAGSWMVYDADMQKVGEGDFGFFDSLFGKNDNYDSSFFANHGSLNIDASAVDADFQYVVLTTGDGIQGKFSSFFVEDVSYEVADNYHYELTLENIPMNDNPTAVYIDGLGDGVYLEDSEGQRVGSFEDGSWYLDEDDINDLNTLSGSIELDIVSDESIDIAALTPEITLIETDYDTTVIAVLDGTPVISVDTSYFDFDDLDEVQRIDLSESEIDNQTLNLQGVMDLSNGDKYLEIVGGDEPNQELTLSASDWEIKTDDAGNELSFDSDGSSYNIYASLDDSHDFELLIDEKVAIILEN